MTARSKARKEALDRLFESDLRNTSVDLSNLGDLREYSREILIGVGNNLTRIDELIRSYIQGWDFDRIPSVDRNILRLAIWELLWSQTPEAVVIDEALQLASDLSTENSPNFIHGVLSKLALLKGKIAL